MSYRCEVLADSLNPAGVRLTTLLIRFPRIVLAEFNTHRMFSRNSASSRAIPVEKRIAAAREDPFVPAAFGANKRGMSAGEALTGNAAEDARDAWIAASRSACNFAEEMSRAGVHKQWANRLIEPFSWTEVIVSATEWSNFFHLRISEHAQPEIRAAAVAMKEAMDASKVRRLATGEWHLPLVTDEDRDWIEYQEDIPGANVLVKLSVARCARVSYLTHDGRRDPTADVALHDSLLTNGHMSPFEHAAKVLNFGGMVGNFRGFEQYRKTIANESDRLGEHHG